MNAYAWFVRGKEHAAMANTSIASVRRADPEARCIVVTDEERRDWKVDALMLQCEPGPIMLANLEAQVNALSYAWNHDADRVVFLDTDTIFLRQFDYLGAVNFTWRDNIGTDDDGEKVEGIAKRMPYNYGVILARPSISAIEAFIWMRERVRNMHPTHQQWYGNQLAAAELAGAPPASGSELAIRKLPWRLTSLGKPIGIGKLPCEVYNYTPQKAGEDVTDKCVLHFKGRKRGLMEGYARAMGLPWELEQPSTPLAAVNIL
jgi:hypothetical protein